MDTANPIAWIAAGALASAGGWIVILNYYAVFSGYCMHRHRSLIPLVGGLALAGALLVSPVRSAATFAWIPLVLDPGCLYSVVGFLYSVIVLRAFDR